MTGRLFEILKGFREIHLHCAQEWAQSEMARSLERLIVLGNRLRRINFWVDKGIYLINLSASLLIYGTSAYFVFRGELTIGQFMALIQYISLMHRKFNWMLRIYLDWYARKISIDRVNELLAVDTEKTSAQSRRIASIDSIEFRHVSFSYNSKVPVLKDISFVIRRGEHIGFVGSSGVGKSTLVGLIMGFYQPDEGTILINGIELKDLSPFCVRQRVGMVCQDVLLFRASVRENLELGISCTEDKLWSALKAVQMYEAVRRLPQGLDTVLGSAGCDLSGGQKQRLMLARLFLKSRSLFILDEATSALDVETEEQIVRNINGLTECATVLVISHREAAIRDCDRIFLLHDQTIAATGTHEYLMEHSPVYVSLYRRQNE